MNNFDLIFNSMFLAIFLYQIAQFVLQYFVLKRIDLLYYSLFLLSALAFYFIFHISIIYNVSFLSFLKTAIFPFKMSFAFIQNFFYISFVVHYLNLKNTRMRIAYLLEYYKYYNLIFAFVFILLGAIGVDSNYLYTVVTLLTLPITVVLLFMLWQLNTRYSNVVLTGTTCTVLGMIFAFSFILYGVYTHVQLPFSEYMPAQLGILCDIIILGYGLSLKAAEADRKLVIALQANQKLIEDERSRVAKDLHDGLGGLLSGIKLTLNSMTGNVVLSDKNAGIFTRALMQLDNAISEMRRVAHSMMPEALLRFGLIQAVQDFCGTMNESKTVQITFKQFGIQDRLDNTMEVTLYRIIQELVNNAVKHANAQHIIIQLIQNEHQLTLTVEDNGNGFDMNTYKEIKGFGLSNIQSRVDYLGATMEVDSKANIGTSFYITIPV